MDNLNTHSIGSLYEAFDPTKAFTLAQRLEMHHAPKCGSWLNIAEIELSALTRQCLDRRIADLDRLTPNSPHGRTLPTPTSDRSTGASPPATLASNWLFRKLRRLYPELQRRRPTASAPSGNVR
jgi:hypothetical protein